MIVPGRVQHGVVVLEGDVSLPEGAFVTVSCPDLPPPEPSRQPGRVRLPLVPSKHPGSLPLTADRVAELLEDEDVPA